MKQAEVFGFLYEELQTRVAFALEESSLPDLQFSIVITDLCQLLQDKNGQRIIVDERRYELPSLFAMLARVEVVSESWNRCLIAAGYICGYMKDHAVVELGDYNWHGNIGGRTFFEPLIRDVHQSGAFVQDEGHIYLEYRIEAGINSSLGEEFKRVEKRDLRTEKME